MKITDSINNASNIKIDEEFVNKVENTYSCKLPETVKRILSIDSNIDFEDRDVIFKLSDEMILEASEEMSSDFKGNHFLPIFDKFDNDYVCYDFANNLWCMFNTVNDRVFAKHENLSELL